MRYLIFILLAKVSFANEPQVYTPCTSAILIIKHDYTPYCLTPEGQREQDEKERVIKEEFRKAAEQKAKEEADAKLKQDEQNKRRLEAEQAKKAARSPNAFARIGTVGGRSK